MAALQGCSRFVRGLVVGPVSVATNALTHRGAVWSVAVVVTGALIGAMGVVAPAQVAQAAPSVTPGQARLSDPVSYGNLAGICNGRTTDCIKAVLTTTEPYPPGFLVWLRQRRARNGVHQGDRRGNTLAGWRAMLTGGDHCSKAPDKGPNFNFINACDTHDLGYELMRFFGTQGPRIPGARQYVDSLFLNDMRADCHHRNLVSRNLCYAAARLYYTVIQRVSSAGGWGIPSVIDTDAVQNSLTRRSGTP